MAGKLSGKALPSYLTVQTIAVLPVIEIIKAYANWAGASYQFQPAATRKSITYILFSLLTVAWALLRTLV